MHGVALVIIGSQLPKVLGIRAEGETTLDQFVSLLPRLGDTNLVALAIGVASFAVILLCRRFRAARARRGGGAGRLPAGRGAARPRPLRHRRGRPHPDRTAAACAAAAGARRLRRPAGGGARRRAALLFRHDGHGPRLRRAQPLSHRRQPGAFGHRRGQPDVGREPGPADQRQRSAYRRCRGGGRAHTGQPLSSPPSSSPSSCCG